MREKHWVIGYVRNGLICRFFVKTVYFDGKGQGPFTN